MWCHLAFQTKINLQNILFSKNLLVWSCQFEGENMIIKTQIIHSDLGVPKNKNLSPDAWLFFGPHQRLTSKLTKALRNQTFITGT
jgi:hypothetical protein